jgi:hypothetical protein
MRGSLGKQGNFVVRRNKSSRPHLRRLSLQRCLQQDRDTSLHNFCTNLARNSRIVAQMLQ